MVVALFFRSLLFSVISTGVFSLPSYQSKIPNGVQVQRNGVPHPGVGHVASGGGGALNAFGRDFQAAGHVWTTALCQKDSDGDGQANGLELGDPECVWKEGQTPQRSTDISHPGFAESVTSASAPTPTPTRAPTRTPTLASGSEATVGVQTVVPTAAPTASRETAGTQAPSASQSAPLPTLAPTLLSKDAASPTCSPTKGASSNGDTRRRYGGRYLRDCESADTASHAIQASIGVFLAMGCVAVGVMAFGEEWR